MPKRVTILLTTRDDRARLWIDQLESLGARVVSAADGAQALERPIDAVLIVAPSPDAPGEERLAEETRASLELPCPASVEVAAAIVDTSIDAADRIVLPRDATPREVALACLLAAEKARSRRLAHVAADEHRRLRHLAERDPLTDLANRRAWDDDLARRFAESTASGATLCVAVFDLDRFKQVNDLAGHAAGDDLLRITATALKDSVREHDLAARLGGDEFGLLISGVDAAQAARIIERARKSISRAAAAIGPRPITASAGYCLYHAAKAPPDAGANIVSPDQLFQSADRALTEAKAAGRDQSRAAADM